MVRTPKRNTSNQEPIALPDELEIMDDAGPEGNQGQAEPVSSPGSATRDPVSLPASFLSRNYPTVMGNI